MKTWPKNMKDESSGRERTEFPSGFNTALSQCAEAIESISEKEIKLIVSEYFEELHQKQCKSIKEEEVISGLSNKFRAFLLQRIGKSDPR